MDYPLELHFPGGKTTIRMPPSKDGVRINGNRIRHLLAYNRPSVSIPLLDPCHVGWDLRSLGTPHPHLRIATLVS